MNKKLQIRNSTAEFLVFSKQAGENTIEVAIENETVWLTQKLLSVLFEVEVNTINYHIKEIYKVGEQSEEATIRKFRIVQTEGKRQVEREILNNPGQVTAEIAKTFAESEFKKYRVVQDKLWESDFDKIMKKLSEL